MATRLKSKPKPGECVVQMVRCIHENRRLLDRELLAEFTQKQHGSLGSLRLKQPNVAESIRFRIDRSVQPVPLIVELNHGLVDRDVIQFRIAVGLYVGFLHPVVDRRPAPFDTHPRKKPLGIRK